MGRSRIKTCWRKFSCLLLVLAQKSSRCTTSDCFSSSPASFTIVTLLFFPNGGLVSTISYSPCFPASASFTIGGDLCGVAFVITECDVREYHSNLALRHFLLETFLLAARLLNAHPSSQGILPSRRSVGRKNSVG